MAYLGPMRGTSLPTPADPGGPFTVTPISDQPYFQGAPGRAVPTPGGPMTSGPSDADMERMRFINNDLQQRQQALAAQPQPAPIASRPSAAPVTGLPMASATPMPTRSTPLPAPSPMNQAPVDRTLLKARIMQSLNQRGRTGGLIGLMTNQLNRR